MKSLEITDAAGEYLLQMLEKASAGDSIRFVFGLAGLEPQPSAVLPGDMVFTYQGQEVLVLDTTMVQMLAGKTLDVEETQQGPILRLL